MNKPSKFILLLFSLILLSSCGTPIPTLQPATSTQYTSTQGLSPSSTPIPTASPTATFTPTRAPVCPSLSTATSGISIELYGNFHTMGIIVSIGDDDPDQDALALVEYRTGSESFQPGFPLSRVSENEFIGSLFWLEPGNTYDVRVTFVDERDRLHCSSISSSAATRSEITPTEPLNTLVVSPDGSGTLCNLDNPCPLTIGINLAMPGDSVLLRGGIYYQGDITLPRSGTEDAPIVIQGAPGEQAILDGGDPNSFTWEPRENGIYETIVNVSDPSLVMVDGQRLYRYQNFQDLEDLSWGLPGFLAQGYRIYVHLNDNSDPNDHKMVISRRMFGLWVDQDYIHIKNLTFRHFEVRWYRAGLYFRNSSHNLIQDCTFAINGYGIILQGASHQNLIENNEFYDTIYDWSWDAVKALHDNTGQGMETGGIRIYDPHRTGPTVMPRGTVIRRNTFHDFFDGFGICTFETAAVPSNETDVYENHIYRMGDDGVEADGYCSNVRIWNNTFADVLVGISVAPARIGPTYLIRNLVYNIGKPSGCPYGREGPCGGTGLKVQYNDPGSGPIFLFHNTMDGGPHHTIFIAEDAQWPLLLSRNNNYGSPWSDGPFGIEVDDPIDFDYDNIISRVNSTLVYWRGDNYDTLEAFTRASGQETHGLSMDPLFTDPSAGDYSLLPDSPLIDAGEYIPGINQTYLGLGPDIGAFEFNQD